MLNVLVVLAVVVTDSPKTFITAASGMRLRATAAANAAEVTRLPICTVLKELEAPGAKVNVGGQDGVWEHLESSDGKQGWMFSPGLRVLDAATADETYVALAAERAGKKDMTFVERADLYNCLKRASAESKDPERGGKLALARFTVLRDALSAVGNGSEKQPYKGFLAQHKDDVVYSEPAGEWFANAKSIWDMEAKYHATSSAEPLAWLAASTNHPGECEDYLGCYLAYSEMEEGEYLKRHTTGAHVGAALKLYGEYKVENAFIDELDGADIAGIIKQVDEQLTLIRACAESPERKKAEKAMTALRNALKKKQKA
ncbi:MAG TPA: hypothetical protein VLC93_10995 [Myxococcota bacterium]|nr:hypothetical protein [Myxococcota bacterium]